jgi:hypothetical protein
VFFLFLRNHGHDQNIDEFTPAGFGVQNRYGLVTVIMTRYGLGFRRSNTLWKDPGVYFYMDMTLSL